MTKSIQLWCALIALSCGLIAAPALATPTPILVPDFGSLTGTAGSAGAVALVESFDVHHPAPEVQYNWTNAAHCPFYTALGYVDAQAEVTASGGGLWCMAPNPVDIRNFGATQDFTQYAIKTPLAGTPDPFPLAAFSASGANDLLVTAQNGFNFDNFPYNSASTAPASVTISNLGVGSASCNPPNGTYPAVWNTTSGGHITKIVIKGVKYCAGWTLPTLVGMPSPTSAEIDFVNGTDNGPTNPTGTFPLSPTSNPIGRAINLACALSSTGSVDVVDGAGGEGIAEPINIGQVGGTAGKSCTGVHIKFAGLHALAAQPSALIGWDEGVNFTKSVTYITPIGWNGPVYTTPVDSSGNGYIWDPVALNWPSTSIIGVGSSGLEVTIQLSAPMTLARGQQIYIRGSNVGGTNASAKQSYLDGLWQVDDIAPGYEGCSLPCAATAFKLLNSVAASITAGSVLPQYQFNSMKQNGTNIEVDLVNPPIVALPSTNMYIADGDYTGPIMMTLLNGGSPWSTTATANGVILNGSVWPAGAPTTFLPKGTVTAGVPMGMINIGFNTADIELDNSTIDCAFQIGCVPVSNYGNTQSFTPFRIKGGQEKNYNHVGVFTMGSGTKTFIEGGAIEQQPGGPGPLNTGIPNTIGTLGVRSGYGMAFMGKNGDDFITGATVVPYNYEAFITGIGTLDVALRDVHMYNGVPGGPASAQQSNNPGDGPYYPNLEGTFGGTGSFVFSMFDSGSIVSKSFNGTFPYDQISGNWNYNGFGGYADAPLLFIGDCLATQCNSLPNVNGHPLGIDPNQLAAVANPGVIGGYLYNMMGLRDVYGNVGSGRTWMPGSIAAQAVYNSGPNTFDSPTTTQLSNPNFSFKGAIGPGALTVTPTSSAFSGSTILVSTAHALDNVMVGMAVYCAGLAPGSTVSTVTPGTSFKVSSPIISTVPTQPCSLPYNVQTVNGLQANASNVITMNSVAGIIPGQRVMGNNIQANSTVENVDTVNVKVTLSQPTITGGLTNAQPLAFYGMPDQPGLATGPANGYTIIAPDIFPAPGSSINGNGSFTSVLPAASNYKIAAVQPGQNLIYLAQNSGGGSPPAVSQAGVTLTFNTGNGNNSANLVADVTAGSWTLTNVTYNGTPYSTLVRPGMMISDSGGCLPAQSWIDSYNIMASTLTVENPSDQPVASTCAAGDVFSVVPSSYVFQPGDAGQKFTLLNGAGPFNLYLETFVPAGWTASLLSTSPSRPSTNLTALNMSSSINGLTGGATYTLGAADYDGVVKITNLFNSLALGPGSSNFTVSNYSLPPHAFTSGVIDASKVDATSGTITLAAGQTTFLLKGTTTVATLTVVLPPMATAWDGERVSLTFHPAVTALTLHNSLGGNLINNVTTATADMTIGYQYDAAQNNWYRVQ